MELTGSCQGQKAAVPTPPRYVPHRPLPPYSYVPGRNPHPISDPQGHMHGAEEKTEKESDDWLFGFDLFNHGYYWEAHEAWEQAWIAAGRKGEKADVLKGLIKLAAAGVKAREGKPAGVRRHARRAEQLLSGCAQDDQNELPPQLSKRCRDWAACAQRVCAEAEQFIDAPPADACEADVPEADVPGADPPVRIVFDFPLAPPDHG